MGECFSAWLCLFLESSIDTPSREPSCTMTNRIRESRSCRSVGAEGSNVLGHSEVWAFAVMAWTFRIRNLHAQFDPASTHQS